MRLVHACIVCMCSVAFLPISHFILFNRLIFAASTTTRLAQEEAKLEQIVTQQGGNVTSFMGLVDENAKTVKELKVITSFTTTYCLFCSALSTLMLKRRVTVLNTDAYFLYTYFVQLHYFSGAGQSRLDTDRGDRHYRQ